MDGYSDYPRITHVMFASINESLKQSIGITDGLNDIPALVQ